MDTVLDIKPEFESIGNTLASEPTGGVMYNDASIPYNSGTVTYGGANRNVDLGPRVDVIENQNVKTLEVIDL